MHPLRSAHIIIAIVLSLVVGPIIAVYGMKFTLSEQINKVELKMVDQYAKKADIAHALDKIDRKLERLTTALSRYYKLDK